MGPMRTDQMIDKMHAWEQRFHKEMADEVAHPIAEYTPEKIDRLCEQMQQANRFTWPSDMRVNV